MSCGNPKPISDFLQIHMGVSGICCNDDLLLGGLCLHLLRYTLGSTCQPRYEATPLSQFPLKIPQDLINDLGKQEGRHML